MDPIWLEIQWPKIPTVVLDGNCGLWVLFFSGMLFHPGPGAPTERRSEVMGFPVDGWKGGFKKTTPMKLEP